MSAATTATSSAMTATSITGIRIDPRSVHIDWADGAASDFHHLWLRDNCPQLLHATTRHRVVETSSIPDDVHPVAAGVDADGALRITWAHDDHVSTYSASWLQAHDYSRGVRRVRPAPLLWDSSVGDALPTASWPVVLADPLVRCEFLRSFLAFGVAVLHDVPTEPGTVLDVANELGEVRVTSWGKVFDVVSMIDANSVAYTNLPLVTHTDEGYRDPAPTIQLQHFLRSDTSGGTATLVDGFMVAERIRRDRPDLFELLVTTSLHFHFRDVTAEHRNDGPILELAPDGSVKTVRFSNHSVSPFLVPPDVMEPFYEAYRMFGRLRESDEMQLRIEMGAGDLYMVDNHRTLHGRTGFSGGGARHLQSCYIERDELTSRLTVLERRFPSTGT